MSRILLPLPLLLTAFVLNAAEPSTTPLLRVDAGMHNAQIRRATADAAGRLMLTVSEDKTARLWELPSGRLLRVLRPPVGEGSEGKLYGGALSPDGTLAAVGGWTGYEWDGSNSIYFFETATGRMLRRIAGLGNVINDITFSPKGRYLAVVMCGGHGVRVYETASAREVGQDTDYSERHSLDVEWHGEDRLVTTGYDGYLRLYQLSGGKLTLQKKSKVKGGSELFTARFSPDGRRIAVGFLDSTKVSVVDGSDLSFLYSPATDDIDNGNLGTVLWADDGATLAATGIWQKMGDFPIRRWPESGRGRPQDTVVAVNTIQDLWALPGGRILFAASDPAWGAVERGKPGDSGDKRPGAPPLADHRSLLENFRFSPDGSTVIFGYEAYGKVPARFSIGRRELTLLEELPTASSNFVGPKYEGLKVTDWQYTTSVKLNSQPLPLQAYEISRCLAVAGNNDSFLLGTEWWVRSFDSKGEERWKTGVPGTVWGVNIADNNKLAVAAFGDGTIRWYRYDNGQELLAFFPHADRQHWVLWTPQGYYDCSPGAEEFIGWHVNRGPDQASDFFPAAKFRDEFYRPDVIQLVLPNRDVGAAVAQANAAAGRRANTTADISTTLERMQPPVVELTVGGALGEATASGESFILRYRIRSSGSEAVTRVRVLMDGRPLTIELPIPDSSTAEAQAVIPLPSKDCVLALLAENRFAVSEPATLRVARGAPAQGAQMVAGSPVADALKPKLYLLAAGISRYAKNDRFQNLEYAAKDAQDFAAAFQRQDGGLYNKVESRILTDDKATAGDILDGLDWIKQQTTSKDIAVIFLSGHGENDEELRYFFCPHDYDHTRRLRTGVAMEQIQQTLAAVAGKVLFFIDSCHAGNALGKLYAAKGSGSQLDITRLVNELSSAENGAIVFASSTGRQVSVESESWQNGAFTEAIIEGLDGKADLLRNGKITISSLETWIAERVKELSGGTQTPTVAKPQTVPDFPIGLKR